MNPAPFELLCRHPDLFSSSLLVVGNGANQPAEWQQAMQLHQSHFLTWDWMTHLAARPGLGANSHFGVPGTVLATSLPATPDIVLLWPKSRQLGLTLISVLSQSANRVWIIGANDSGGKSIGNACKKIGVTANKVDAARHCSMWQLESPADIPPTSWEEHHKHFTVGSHQYSTLPGVFSHGELDKGTALLLEALAEQPFRHAPPSILDLGCGSGVIGLSLQQRFEEATLTLADTDALALSCCHTNIHRSGMNPDTIQVIASDKLSEIKGRYKLIVTNPPFHTGTETDYRFAQTLFAQARQHLAPYGEIWVVANRHLSYEEWATASFSSVDVVTQAAGFKILRLHSPVKGNQSPRRAR